MHTSSNLMSQFSHLPVNEKQQQQVQTIEKFYFYENQSKMISLKKFTEEIQFSGDSNESIYSNLKQYQSSLTIKGWFAKLMNHEKAVVLTIIDKELVSLLKSMWQCYD